MGEKRCQKILNSELLSSLLKGQTKDLCNLLLNKKYERTMTKTVKIKFFFRILEIKGLQFKENLT